ncbi:MAG TPA: Calx-beta domain-containing protein [Gammaproteobacteria bacterium]|nr:Calx-beta domain-containing protein [Gammaproteobacteria bacterium]
MDKRTAKPSPGKRDETWVLDPSDVQRHARRMRERDRPGPLRGIGRYAALAVAVAAIGAAYWKRETLLGITVDTSALTSLFSGGSPTDVGAPGVDGGEGAASVEAPAVVGTRVTTSIEAQPAEDAAAEVAEAAPARTDPPAPGAAASNPPASDSAAARPQDEPRADPASGTPVAAVQPEPPAPPPEPERFELGLERVTVSESQPSAAVLLLRMGDRRRVSSVTWWTEPGTAKPGSDYVNLGVLTEKFAAGEQNRTLHVPIVGDHNTEGPETFYIVARTRAGDGADIPVTRVEVEIDD